MYLARYTYKYSQYHIDTVYIYWYTMFMSEVLKVPIKGYENLYWITSDGEIISKKCTLKPSLNSNGYPSVSLSKDNYQRTKPVHKLIALHFIPNPDNLPQINHINGIKTDYRISNLEWCTAKHNMQHAWRTGLITTDAHDTKTAKLTIKEVHEIYLLCIHRIDRRLIARLYGVSIFTVKGIREHKHWKHLNLKEFYENRTEEENHIQADKLFTERLERIQSAS